LRTQLKIAISLIGESSKLYVWMRAYTYTVNAHISRLIHRRTHASAHAHARMRTRKLKHAHARDRTHTHLKSNPSNGTLPKAMMIPKTPCNLKYVKIRASVHSHESVWGVSQGERPVK